MRKADERVCIYTIILTDTWDHIQKRTKDTEMVPCTESVMILEANEENREKVAGGNFVLWLKKYPRIPEVPERE